VLDSRAGYEGLFGITLFEALYKNMNYGWGIRQSGHYLIIGLAYGRLPKNLKREMGSTSPFSIPLDHFGLAHATGSGRIESPDSIEPRKL